MLGKLLGHDKRQIEYVFAEQSVTTFARRDHVEDPRTLGDKLLLRKLEPVGPAWTVGPEGAEFSAGGGALGDGSLWTRPVELEAGLDLESAYVQLLERRMLDGGAGGVSLVAHVRARAVVGPADDVESRAFPVHAHEDAPDDVWHSTLVDLAPFLARHLAKGRYLTLEVKAESTRGAAAPRAVVVSVRPIVLTMVSAPREPVAAWSADARP